VMEAVRSFDFCGKELDVVTVGEAVGSDITNVVGNALLEGRVGAAQLVLSNFLAHDLPVAVSQFTKDLIVEAGEKVDEVMGTAFARRLTDEVKISYPAIDAASYLAIEENPDELYELLKRRGLSKDGYVMFLSRIAPAKGVDDLLDAWEGCRYRGEKELIICGNGPAKDDVAMRAADLGDVRVLDDVSDLEKGALMHGCAAWCLPSKPKTEFVETFGIAVAEKMLAGGLGPVITTRTGGIPEASGGHCLEHAAGDVGELRACLDKACEMKEPERRALSKSARDFALQFDRNRIFERLVSSLSARIREAV